MQEALGTHEAREEHDERNPAAGCGSSKLNPKQRTLNREPYTLNSEPFIVNPMP